MMELFFKKMEHPSPLFHLLLSSFQTSLPNKNVLGSSGIRTGTVRVEGENIDHFVISSRAVAFRCSSIGH